MDGDGVETVGLSADVYFDLDNNGFAEKTTWVASDDALLVLDRNADGTINNGGELFGTETLLANGQFAANGFEALADLDENHDGKIDANDSAYTSLNLWRDLNQNGISDEGELATLAASGVTSIGLTFEQSDFVDANGVGHRELGEYTLADGTNNAVSTLWFDSDRRFTVATDIQMGANIEISAEIAALPDMVGFGNLYSLHQAMARDESGVLQALVTSFVTENDPEVRKQLVGEILIVWAGQEDVVAGSRGGFMDAQQLGILETVWGERLSEQANPGSRYANILNPIYQQFASNVYYHLVKNTQLNAEFDLTYFTKNSVTGEWSVNFSEVIPYLIDQLLVDPDAYAAKFIDYLYAIDGVDPYQHKFSQQFNQEVELAMGELDQDEFDLVASVIRHGDDNLSGSDNADVIASYAGNDVVHGLGGDDQIDGGAGNDRVFGGAGDDQVNGDEGDDIVYGDAGNDVLDGGAGKDYLYGGEGNDTLRGGAGVGDYLSGEAGNDTYLFGLGDGDTTVYNYDTNAASVDIARFEDVSVEELWFSRNGSNLQITVAGTDDRVTISNWYSNANYQLDRIEVGSSVLLNSQVEQLVSAMASYNVPSGAGNVIPQEVKDNLQPVIAEVWQQI